MRPLRHSLHHLSPGGSNSRLICRQEEQPQQAWLQVMTHGMSLGSAQLSALINTSVCICRVWRLCWTGSACSGSKWQPCLTLWQGPELWVFPSRIWQPLLRHRGDPKPGLCANPSCLWAGRSYVWPTSSISTSPINWGPVAWIRQRLQPAWCLWEDQQLWAKRRRLWAAITAGSRLWATFNTRCECGPFLFSLLQCF